MKKNLHLLLVLILLLAVATPFSSSGQGPALPSLSGFGQSFRDRITAPVAGEYQSRIAGAHNNEDYRNAREQDESTMLVNLREIRALIGSRIAKEEAGGADMSAAKNDLVAADADIARADRMPSPTTLGQARVSLNAVVNDIASSTGVSF